MEGILSSRASQFVRVDSVVFFLHFLEGIVDGSPVEVKNEDENIFFRNGMCIFRKWRIAGLQEIVTMTFFYW